MLSILPYQRRTNSADNNRMKPARQTRSILCWVRADCRTASKPARSLPNGLLSMVSVATPLARALSRPKAPERLEMTTTISAGKSCSLAASIRADMFDPRPEIRMATRRFIASPAQIKMAVVSHAVLACGRDHLTQQGHGLAALGQNRGDLFDRIRFDDGDHADAAVEGAQQFEFGDAALLCQPLEHRQHRKPRQVDPDAEMLWQHAGNIIGEAAAGDVGKSLDRAGLVDRPQARPDIEPRRRQQSAAQRHERRKRRLRFETETGRFDDPADQRKSV